ncbi:MAG: hypothetical protein K2X27_09635 [Candidatus Obscuribacterales bacterium]|nr:hypothetical protein [Candidatus Obscuribacterales bacterium]
MQIRQQLALILGLPIACELVTAAVLISSYQRVDELALRELNAKKATALGLQLSMSMEQTVLLTAKDSLLGKSTSGIDKQRQRINKYFNEIQEFAKADTKTQEILSRWKENAFRFLDLWEEYVHAYSSGHGRTQYFSQFLCRGDLNESMLYALNSVHEDADALLARYSRDAQELNPESIEARSFLNMAIIAAVAINIMLVLAFAHILGKKTLSRLELLRLNMNEFSRGKVPTKSLSGEDELATIDRAFREMAEERAKLEELKDSMRAMVSHDLRSPLTSMALKLEVMLNSAEEQVKQAGEEKIEIARSYLRDLKLLHSETGRLTRLANTLLDIEKIEDGSVEVQLRSLSCLELIKISEEAIISQSKRKNISILQELQEGASFYCDKDRCIQVLVNLLSNAVKFAPKNSRIDIVVNSVAETERLRLEVLDEGPGVPEDKQSRLFAKFSQLEQAEDVRKQGSGLGLYICKMLIEAQGGSIGYKRRENGGSCFWFELKAAPSSDLEKIE